MNRLMKTAATTIVYVTGLVILLGVVAVGVVWAMGDPL